MPKPFDATLYGLIDGFAADWAAFLAARMNVPFGPVEVIDTDLSTTLQADSLFRIDGPAPAVLHLELESSGRLGIPERVERYNSAARGATKLHVRSVVILLRPEANASDLTGIYELTCGERYLWFKYTVVRLWLEPFDALLSAGAGLAPLAMLTNEAAANLPGAAARLRAHLIALGLPQQVIADLLGCTAVLCGLRYTKEQIREAEMGGRNVLEDSVIYQELIARGEALGVARGEALGIARGEAKGLQLAILQLATRRFGVPSPEVESAIRSTNDLDRLRRINLAVLDANNWDDLIATA